MSYEYELHETILEVKDVCHAYGKDVILKDVSVTIRDIVRPGLSQGQVVGFLGPSGVGKTTLFRILAGLLPPQKGEVLVTDKKLPVHAGMVGVVSQNYLLFEHRTVLGNLLVAGRQAGLSDKAAAEKAQELLERFGLRERRNHWPAQLSGGQRQRAAIAQQLMCSEHFLLMDEPFSGLDPVMKDRVCGLISEVAAMDELNTIIVVTHDIGSALQIADTVWLMGRERASDGSFISGGYIKEQINLIDRGIAWRPDIPSLPQYAECLREIRAKFQTL